MKTALCINGFGQHIDGSKNDWEAADVLDQAGFDVTAREERVWNWDADVVTHADIVPYYDAILGYSWAWKSLIQLGRENLNCGIFLGVLPVNDPCGLCDDIVLPATVKKAVVLQVTPPNAFPISKPLALAPWVGFVDLDAPNVAAADKDGFWNCITSALSGPNYLANRLNINCNVLATSANAIDNHSRFCNLPQVLSLLRRLALNA